MHASSKALTLSWKFLLYRNQSTNFSTNQQTGFCIIETSVMKDSKLSSSTYTESLFLHLAKHNLLFFFYLAFLSQIFMIHQTAGEGRCHLLIFFLPLPPASQTLAELLLQRARLCAQLAARIQHGTFGTCSLEFALSKLTLALVLGEYLKLG